MIPILSAKNETAAWLKPLLKRSVKYTTKQGYPSARFLSQGIYVLEIIAEDKSYGFVTVYHGFDNNTLRYRFKTTTPFIVSDAIPEKLQKYIGTGDVSLTVAESRLLKEYVKQYLFKILSRLFPYKLKRISKEYSLHYSICELEPLYRTWLRAGKIWRDGIGQSYVSIYDNPYSFERIIRIGTSQDTYVEIPVRKWRFKNWDHAYVKEIYMSSKAKVMAKFYYKIEPDKVVVYRIHDKYVEGWEIYKNIIHNKCEIEIQDFDDDLFINYRLGDLLFIPRQRKVDIRLGLVDDRNLEKIKVLNGEIIKEYTLEPALKVYEPEGVIYHPEHGVLKLPQGEYIVRRVWYMSRSHD